MRILSVGNMYPPHHYGGYELVWHSAVRHLVSHGHEVRVLTTDMRTSTSEADDDMVHRELRWALRGAEFEELGPLDRVQNARRNHRVLDRHLLDYRPDAVAWWSMGGLSLTLMEDVRRRGLPAVAFVHDDWLGYGPWADQFLRSVTGPRRGQIAPLVEAVLRLPARVEFASAAHYVFVSEFLQREAFERHGLRLDRTSVAPSGIDPAFLGPAPEQEWGWRLLYVGRLDARKGVHLALGSLVQLPCEATLRIVGGWDAAEERRLREMALRLSLEGRVSFGGQRPRTALPLEYDAADVVVFPVLWDEPWGLVPLEAMARGRLVVATGRGGSAEYLRDEENCLLFDPDDEGALPAAVRRLANDQDLRRRLRAQGLATARSYTETAFNEKVERVLVAAADAGEESASALAAS